MGATKLGLCRRRRGGSEASRSIAAAPDLDSILLVEDLAPLDDGCLHGQDEAEESKSELGHATLSQTQKPTASSGRDPWADGSSTQPGGEPADGSQPS